MADVNTLATQLQQLLQQQNELREELLRTQQAMQTQQSLLQTPQTALAQAQLRHEREKAEWKDQLNSRKNNPDVDLRAVKTPTLFKDKSQWEVFKFHAENYLAFLDHAYIDELQSAALNGAALDDAGFTESVPKRSVQLFAMLFS